MEETKSFWNTPVRDLTVGQTVKANAAVLVVPVALSVGFVAVVSVKERIQTRLAARRNK